MKTRLLIALSSSFLLSSCGLTFQPGYSAEDRSYFQKAPHIVDTSEETSLVWTYGKAGFYFQPRYKVRNGALYFSLQGTTSTGNVSGKESRLSIEDQNARNALRSGGAYWWNADGSTTRLQVNP